jgi:hypothetical protein
MPSLAAFGVSFASALQPVTPLQRLSSYLDGDAIVPGDECRQCALCIKNVDQRHLDASGESLRHLLTLWEGREAVTPRSEVRRDGTVGGEKVLCLPR